MKGNMMSVLLRAVDVVLDHLDPPDKRLGRTDWCMNVEKIVRALDEEGLLASDHTGGRYVRLYYEALSRIEELEKGEPNV